MVKTSINRVGQGAVHGTIQIKREIMANNRIMARVLRAVIPKKQEDVH